MTWIKSIASVDKGFFPGEKEPKAIIFFESLGFWNSGHSVAIKKEVWEEIGKVMGWKTK